MSRRNIILYFPYMKVGGVSLLFLRLAKVLREENNVYIVDFADGYMGSRTPEGVHFIDFKRVQSYPENAIVIIQSAIPWTFPDADKFNPNTRILFWNLHPNNLYPYIFSTFSTNSTKRFFSRLLLPLSILRKRKLAMSIEYLISKNSLSFMDKENYTKTQEYYPNLNIPMQLLPVMTEQVEKIDLVGPRDPLRCCWVGRIADFKVYVLEHLLKRLNEESTFAGRIVFTVIGQGDYINWLKEAVSRFRNIDIVYIDELSPEHLGEYYKSKVDVLFAMGTSAIEGASRGIPTFLLDYSYGYINRTYKFSYIYSADGYCLGREIDDSMYEAESTLGEKLKALGSDFQNISQACYDYWLGNFSPEAVKDKFLSCIDDSGATIGEMRTKGFLESDFISYHLKKFRYSFSKRESHSGFKDY